MSPTQELLAAYCAVNVMLLTCPTPLKLRVHDPPPVFVLPLIEKLSVAPELPTVPEKVPLIGTPAVTALKVPETVPPVCVRATDVNCRDPFESDPVPVQVPATFRAIVTTEEPETV